MDQATQSLYLIQHSSEMEIPLRSRYCMMYIWGLIMNADDSECLAPKQTGRTLATLPDWTMPDCSIQTIAGYSREGEPLNIRVS
ncbi:MAG: hypothetical protein CYG59_14450 [Chloroflexi bacterium]|nr:MAG: hypothetical protein CYG59_14450 [Chloroflexota bacterium]